MGLAKISLYGKTVVYDPKANMGYLMPLESGRIDNTSAYVTLDPTDFEFRAKQVKKEVFIEEKARDLDAERSQVSRMQDGWTEIQKQGVENTIRFTEQVLTALKGK